MSSTSTLDKLSRWVNLKLYQLEVTFSVYIFTPLEKFFFYSVLFLFVSLTFIATILYLPQHIAFIIDRAWFYVHGDTAGVPDMLAGSGNSGPPAQTTATYLKEL